ncbi:hypothetical protein K2173_021743 [Erythroxylum novogranatense]|uniref:PRLI-interacting factor A n=1 Tax=Erythroxylum novogranatense TaxID=1862640 RepID=A0AAV8TXH5_9ROSI|nr:hypothetical protein K2173_021743 [Erythroxylum novogranatense]
MNDQSQIMSQQLQQQPPMMSQQPPPMMNQIMTQAQMLGHSQGLNLPPMMLMNQRSGYKPWSNQDPNFPLKFNSNFVASKSRNNNKKNWKGKNVNFKDQQQRRMENPTIKPNSNSGGGGGYKPPSLNELQAQNQMKARNFYHPKKKFNNRFAPYAPRNTTSYIIRAKKSGGIASLVSPCPVTPAVLPTPILSPSREMLGDMVKEEWGVDGYGSMKGLIRLRSSGNEAEEEEEGEEGNGSSESDVEEHVEVERRLDHDLSRFEMIYPSYGGGVEYNYSCNNVLENRVDDQDSHIIQLEEENLTLKERLFLMEREMKDLRRRLQFLERQPGGGGGGRRRQGGHGDVNEELVENLSETDENGNESDGGSDAAATTATFAVNQKEVMIKDVDGKGEIGRASYDISRDVNGCQNDVYMEENLENNEIHVKDEVMDDKALTEFSIANEVIVKNDELMGGKKEDGLVFADPDLVKKEDKIDERECDCERDVKG